MSLAEETGAKDPAPKEQPPRKLSGKVDRKANDTLEKVQFANELTYRRG